MPGTDCVHFVRGRCLYQEALNPGLNEAWQCGVLRSLEREYDHTLNRAEAFGLSEAKAARLVQGRMSMPKWSAERCPAQGERPLGVHDAEACDGLRGLVCVWLLPECPGRCRHFKTE